MVHLESPTTRRWHKNIQINRSTIAESGPEGVLKQLSFTESGELYRPITTRAETRYRLEKRLFRKTYDSIKLTRSQQNHKLNTQRRKIIKFLLWTHFSLCSVVVCVSIEGNEEAPKLHLWIKIACTWIWFSFKNAVNITDETKIVVIMVAQKIPFFLRKIWILYYATNKVYNDYDLSDVQKENLLSNNLTSHGKRPHTLHLRKDPSQVCDHLPNQTLSLKTVVKFHGTEPYPTFILEEPP